MMVLYGSNPRASFGTGVISLLDIYKEEDCNLLEPFSDALYGVLKGDKLKLEEVFRELSN